MLRFCGHPFALNRNIADVGHNLLAALRHMINNLRHLLHLRRNLLRPECGVVFVGYASVGTLARKIIDGAKVVKILEDEVPVRASVHTINGFSGHAGRAALIDWRKRVKAPRTFVVHGEVAAMEALAPALPGETVMPAIGDGAEI